jgi:hypothetical protein
MKLRPLLTTSIFLLASSTVVNAEFYIDVKPKPVNAIVEQPKIEKPMQTASDSNSVPEGFEMFSGNFGVVKIIGEGDIERIDSFANNGTLKYAMDMILPPNWIAYIKQGTASRSNISYKARNAAWVDVLKTIGVNYGYRFIVDHKSKSVQIMDSNSYVKQDESESIEYLDPDSQRKIYVYTQTPERKKGFLMIDGKPVEVKLIK